MYNQLPEELNLKKCYHLPKWGGGRMPPPSGTGLLVDRHQQQIGRIAYVRGLRVPPQPRHGFGDPTRSVPGQADGTQGGSQIPCEVSMKADFTASSHTPREQHRADSQDPGCHPRGTICWKRSGSGRG